MSVLLCFFVIIHFSWAGFWFRVSLLLTRDMIYRNIFNSKIKRSIYSFFTRIKNYVLSSRCFHGIYSSHCCLYCCHNEHKSHLKKIIIICCKLVYLLYRAYNIYTTATYERNQCSFFTLHFFPEMKLFGKI